MDNNQRTRNWVFICYPENISDFALDEILTQLQVQAVRSPLHAPVGDGVEDERKAHWHILLCFDGVKSFNQVKEIADRCGGCRPVPCHSVRGSCRYFVHADNPEKEQFKGGYTELKAFGGLNIFDLFCPTSAEKDAYIMQMQDWIVENDIYEFSDLLDYSKERHSDTWYFLLTHGSAHLMTIYICSRRNKKKRDIEAELASIRHARHEIIRDFQKAFENLYCIDRDGLDVSISDVYESLIFPKENQ